MRLAAAIIILAITIACGLSACGNDNTPIPLVTDADPSETPALTASSSPAPTAQESETPGETTSPTSEPAPTPGETTIPVSEPPQTTTPATGTPRAPDFKVVGYITHWHFSRLPGLNLEGLTHLIWQGIEVTSGGDPTLRVANNDEWAQITEAVKTGHDKDIKVLASLIGAWNKSDLNEILRLEEQRKKLVENLKNLVESYGLDGIDIDNENTPPDKTMLSIFIKELYETLSPLGKIITMAGNPFDVRIYPDTFHCVDFFNLMTYDMGKGAGYPYHSTIEESIQALNFWANKGVPKEKLLIGIPLYGRDGGTGFYEYRWIVDKYNPDPDQNEASEPAAAGGIIWWNGVELVKEKTLYVKDNNYGGVMLYEIGTDSHGDFSLLESVFRTLDEQQNTNIVQDESSQQED